jgi:exonuclease SbcD
MKILHTSDWHIGRKIYDGSVDETLSFFFDWLITEINKQKIDVLIVAGDIFNNPFPSQSAYELYYRTLYRLSQTNLKQIILTGGNHDSAKTLEAPQELLKLLKINVIGSIPENPQDLIIEIQQNNKVELAVFAVPFLRDRDIRKSAQGQTDTEIAENIRIGTINYYKKIAKLAENYKQKNIPVIATGHLFVNDISEMDEASKSVYIGSLQQLSSSNFPDIFDYYALGHIHIPYKVGNGDKARYSGSPIHLNFSKKMYQPQVILIDIDAEKKNIKPIKVPVFRQLISLEGTFDEIEEKLLNYQNDKPLKTWADIYIIENQQDLTLEKRIENLKRKLKNIEIIRFRYNFLDTSNQVEEQFAENTDLRDIQPIDIFEKLIVNLPKDDATVLMDTFNNLINNKLYEDL